MCSPKILSDGRGVQEIIDNFHCSKTNQRELDETEQRIKSRYNWSNLGQTIQN